MGNVSGLFVATEEDVKAAIGQEIYFGEILGKHSEIYGTLEEKEVTKVALDSTTVAKVAEILGTTWSGYNPLAYVRRECAKCAERGTMDEFGFKKVGAEWLCANCHPVGSSS